MAQEVRSILFTTEETHAAVADMLMQRIRGLQRRQVDQVEIEERSGVVRTTVRFSKELNATRVLDPNELMSAILSFCRRARIPLSSRSQKRLGVMNGCLSLTTAINLHSIEPTVEGDTVIHAIASPDLAALHSAR